MKASTKIAVGLGIMAALASSSAFAATVALDFGFGTPVGSMDWTPGNALAKGAIPLPVGPAGFPPQKSFDLYYQARLGNFQDTSNNVISGTGLNTPGGYEITAVIGFGEKGNTSASGTTATANFDLDSSRPSYVYFYKDVARDANDLTGAGFTNGNLFLSGHVVGLVGSNFGTRGVVSNLDNTADGNNWATANAGAGQLTLNGTGGTNVLIQVDAFNQDEAVIQTPINLFQFMFSLNFDTSNNLPFNKVNPTQNMFTGAGGNYQIWDGVAGVTTLGATNGVNGPDMLFQADAITSFDLTQVPEPSTFVLAGLGLLAVGGVLRRRVR
ncbi:PEP-CTERM sorting domain-containing protein [Geobacter hydrogenophilus]|uniref:Ice-binding protein C-terminal domain-containing protein n=1 Tax=Geobacter hydrogenophilus TaxID=40983 RepID=A0A9W6LDS5_9BACT|nr:PEP-CTERM sorting domain-containing protein [Geobacter hydrogenophilus]MBT0895759.1 PEP-CTERM sorting domain-containing protein [Geobacter hydrogenophilus]GLI39270.1 hypothetical protein GHYDROH2_27710 [Geobacter hydrogenophilus]